MSRKVFLKSRISHEATSSGLNQRHITILYDPYLSEEADFGLGEPLRPYRDNGDGLLDLTAAISAKTCQTVPGTTLSPDRLRNLLLECGKKIYIADGYGQERLVSEPPDRNRLGPGHRENRPLPRNPPIENLIETKELSPLSYRHPIRRTQQPSSYYNAYNLYLEDLQRLKNWDQKWILFFRSPLANVSYVGGGPRFSIQNYSGGTPLYYFTNPLEAWPVVRSLISQDQPAGWQPPERPLTDFNFDGSDLKIHPSEGLRGMYPVAGRFLKSPAPWASYAAEIAQERKPIPIGIGPPPPHLAAAVTTNSVYYNLFPFQETYATRERKFGSLPEQALEVPVIPMIAVTINGIEFAARDLQLLYNSPLLDTLLRAPVEELDIPQLTIYDVRRLKDVFEGRLPLLNFYTEMSNYAFSLLGGARTLLHIFEFPLARFFIMDTFSIGMPLVEQLARIGLVDNHLLAGARGGALLSEDGNPEYDIGVGELPTFAYVEGISRLTELRDLAQKLM